MNMTTTIDFCLHFRNGNTLVENLFEGKQYYHTEKKTNDVDAHQFTFIFGKDMTYKFPAEWILLHISKLWIFSQYVSFVLFFVHFDKRFGIQTLFRFYKHKSNAVRNKVMEYEWCSSTKCTFWMTLSGCIFVSNLQVKPTKKDEKCSINKLKCGWSLFRWVVFVVLERINI